MNYSDFQAHPFIFLLVAIDQIAPFPPLAWGKGVGDRGVLFSWNSLRLEIGFFSEVTTVFKANGFTDLIQEFSA